MTGKEEEKGGDEGSVRVRTGREGDGTKTREGTSAETHRECTRGRRSARAARHGSGSARASVAPRRIPRTPSRGCGTPRRPSAERRRRARGSNGAMASPVLWIPKLQARARAFRLSRPTRSERFGFGNQAHLSDNLQRLFAWVEFTIFRELLRCFKIRMRFNTLSHGGGARVHILRADAPARAREVFRRNERRQFEGEYFFEERRHAPPIRAELAPSRCARV